MGKSTLRLQRIKSKKATSAQDKPTEGCCQVLFQGTLRHFFLQILQEMLVLLDLRFYINSNSLQENDLSSSSVKTLGEAPDLVFGGRWRQTRKHLMFANKKTSEHSMFRNEKSSGNLKQIGNRIVARVPASLWRVAGNFQIITHHIMCHQCSNSIIKHITLSSTMMKTIRWSGPVLTSSSPSCNSAITQRCSVEGIYSITIIVIIIHHHPSSST